MRAKDIPTDAQLERMNQLTFQAQIDCMSDNLATTLCVLNKYFGFGEKRIRQFLEYTKIEADWFKSFKDEDIARDKIDESLASFGIDHNEIYEQVDFLAYSQAIKQEKRNAVSVKEANDMKVALDFMKQLTGQDRPLKIK